MRAGTPTGKGLTIRVYEVDLADGSRREVYDAQEPVIHGAAAQRSPQRGGA